MTSAIIRLTCVLILLNGALVAHARGQARLIDDGADAKLWTVATSSGVTLTIASEVDSDPRATTANPANKALRIDYDFTRGSGFGIVRRAIAQDLPANYRFSYRIRGEGPSNTVEFKLLDPTGDNVWWVNQRDFAFPASWQEIILPKRKVSFAWGPAGAHTPLKRAEHLEIAITASSGGKGTVWIDDLRFEELPEVKPYVATPRVTTSSHAGTAPTLTSDDRIAWASSPDDQHPSLRIDFGEVRELGGLWIDWTRVPSGQLTIAASATETLDSANTRTHTVALRGSPGRQWIPIPNLTARLIELRTDRAIEISGIGFMPPEFGEDMNEVLKAAAMHAPRGAYPRYLVGEAMYFTVAGASGDTKEALISEDGATEVDKLAFTIEPFILEELAPPGTTTAPSIAPPPLRSWSNAKISHDLIDHQLPIPAVSREHDGLTLSTIAWVEGTAGASHLIIRHTLTNARSKNATGHVFAAIRPIQVNPTYQNLNIVGGFARTNRIDAERTDTTQPIDRIRIDDRVIIPLDAPDAFGASTWASGEIVEHLSRGTLPTAQQVHDDLGLASGALQYRFSLAPGASKSWHVLAPMHREPATAIADRAAYGPASFNRTRALWHEQLDRVTIELPAGQDRIVQSIRANLAYILINRDGPAIQPGSRCYERTWIRDGSLTSAALLSFGFEREVKEFLDWFAPFQYDNGKIPCCADHRGPDPVPEHDSHGQYIYAVKHYFDMTGDSDFLRRHYPRMLKAVEYIEFLRAQRMTPEYRDAPESDLKRAKFGILPESISHEGYSAKPMHSYWDNFFAYKGLLDAAATAELLGDRDNASRLNALRDDFLLRLNDSIARATAIKQIDFLPGCVELGDFDATSTTIALQPCGLTRLLDQSKLNRTFEKYWTNFLSRRDSGAPWRDYTPYEHRVVGTMVHLGQRDRAIQMLDFFFEDQRPSKETGSAGGGGFRHWAEVVFRDPRVQGYVGDMPHTWCGSDFINSVRSMFAYEDRIDDRDALIIGAGLPLSWVTDDKGVRIHALRTIYGSLSFSVRRDPDALHPERSAIFTLQALTQTPPGGVLIRVPDADRIESIRSGQDQAALTSTDHVRISPGVPVRITWKR
ncbi:MAG: hypothetical protein K2W85_03390 [Phycisphaerales bacterium]|nr:hypothetical protein [Phycisphaerales bacterium]